MKNGKHNSPLQFYEESFKTRANIVEFKWSYVIAYGFAWKNEEALIAYIMYRNNLLQLPYFRH